MLGSPSNKVFVTGASSMIGSVLRPLLGANGLQPVILGRKPLAEPQPGTWHFLDLTVKSGNIPPVEGATLIHTASLWLLPDWLEKFHARGVRRVIAFSSTSRFTKGASASEYELEVVNKLITAEEAVRSECERLGIAWTIFRPTLIYGGAGGDRNVADIARLIRKFGGFPLFGGAKGRRQPVNAFDLALACVQSLAVEASYDKAYNLSGGETLTYVDMVRRIFETLGQRAVFVPVPITIFKMAVALARLLPRFSHLTSDMALRMQIDLVFDHSDATQDFGYRPGLFDPTYLKQIQ
jgi:nucleoside-diphosphate-sugar epimerase